MDTFFCSIGVWIKRVLLLFYVKGREHSYIISLAYLCGLYLWISDCLTHLFRRGN